MNKTTFYKIVKKYLYLIYSKDLRKSEIEKSFIKVKSVFLKKKVNNGEKKLWNQSDFFLITYADSIKKKNKNSFVSLASFLKKFCFEFNFIHVLPFFPYSSDDGFAVKDYKKINEIHGDWDDFKLISENFKIMCDLVINHCSSENYLYQNFLKNKNPGKNFFFTINDKKKGLSKVVRPRSSDLLKKIIVDGKEKFVWCTFSHDQVDFNFKNPDLLIYFLQIIRFYLDNNIHAIRLDAVAFLWKELGTRCINLSQTHEIIRLLRFIIDYFYNNVLLITETNIPSHENLSYFGNNNEAHCIYNFTLAPLLINAVISGNSFFLKKWSRSMPPAQEDNSYLNFLSSHDGLGMRPIEGILPESEIKKYQDFLKDQGGLLTYRTSSGKKTVYEVNITLFDALKNTYNNKDNFAIERFLLAHSIMFAFEGIPAVYINNLFGTENDYKKVKYTGLNRAINRKNWEFNELASNLKNKKSKNFKIYNELNKIIHLRKKQPGFHPNATQFTLQLDDSFFGLWRQSIDRSQSIFCISNLINKKNKIPLFDINLISTDSWFDIFTKKQIKINDSELIFNPYQTMWITNKKAR